MKSSRIIYRSGPDATPEAELNALATCYRFILDCHAKKKAAEPAPEPDSCITTQIDRGALVLKPQQMRPSPVNEGNLDTGGHPLDQY
jgi:hypothetical protein